MTDASIQPDLVYDVGLHDGVDTAFYLRSGYRVVAIDANPEAIAHAELVFARAIQDGQLRLVHAAIVAPGGLETVTLYVSEQREWSSLIREIAGRDGVGVHEVEVPTTTLASLIEQFGIPFYLKIDIEGMDDAALVSLASISARPTFVSVEAESADDSGRTDREALQKLDLLVELGYTQFKLVDQDSLRVLAMDDLALGPRRTVANRVRTRLPRQRARSAVLRVAGRRTVFPLGSSGPFGAALAGTWLDEEDARRLLLVSARRAYFRRDDARAFGFWCDWHATS